MNPAIIYKITDQNQWQAAEIEGKFIGAPVDLADGFIHFSTREQVRETAAKHFSGQHNLLLIAVDAKQLGDSLKYELSRNQQLFPHLYAALSLTAVLSVTPLPLDANGQHIFPEL